MRHDDIRKPFTVQGDLPFVLRAFGMPEDMKPDRAHDAFSDYVARVCTATGKACMITTWHATTTGGRTTYVVQAEPIRVASPADPWVKVGTTTIDGTVAQVGEVLRVLKAEIHRDAIDAFLQADEPWLIGGRYLQANRSHIDSHDNTVLIRCDVVRRQSEIEAEGAAKQAEFDREVATMEARDYPYGLPRPPCPECGPHGNRGEVLLASSWAKCTTCAGGKPGDLWGDVRAHEPAAAQGALSSALIAKGASSEVAQAGVRAFIKAIQMDAKVSTPRGVGHVRYQATGGSFRVSLPGQGHVWFEPDEVFEVP